MKIFPLKKMLVFIAFLSGSCLLQAQTVKGVVKGSNEALPGATVLVKGTNNGESTDFDGNYILKNVPENATLVVSFVGYITKEVAVNGRSIINIELDEASNTLDEIVVVGYGTQKRTNLSSAVSSVKADEIAEIPAADIAQTLQGRAAGVFVTQSGSPGGKTYLNIRGVSTIGNSDPLYVVDGVFTTSISGINPSTIKSVDILKDAAAAAIYGSRGSNGVVIVTTDRGTKGKVTFKASTYAGTQFSNKRFDVLNTAQYVQYIKEINAQTDGGGTTIDVVNNDPNFDGNGIETDWQDELFRAAPITNYEFSASGGTDKISFNMGASSFSQEGIYIDTEFNRQTFNANSEFKITDNFKVGETFNLAFTDRIAPQLSDGREPLFNVLSSAPYTPVRNPNGTFSGSTSEDNNNSRNQIRVQDSDDNLTRTTTILGSLYGEYKFFEDFTFRTQLGIDASYTFQDFILRAYDEGGQFSKDDTNVTKIRQRNLSKIFTNSLTYNKTLAEVHNIDVTLVSERQDTQFESLTGASTNDVSSEVPELVASGASTISTTEDEILISYLGRVNYTYDGKYLFSASIRRDKNSRFAPDRQTGYFKAASLGWVASREGFLENSKVINNLKFRASYGETGNNAIPRNSYQSLLASVFNYPTNGNLVLGTAPLGASNLDLTWEKSIKQNYGFDLGLYDDRFMFSAEYFNNENTDLLIQEPLAPSVGTAPTVSKNVGDISNKGFEFTFGYNDYEGDFQWNLWANISLADATVNRLNSVADEVFQAVFVPRQTEISRLAVGEAPFHFYGYIFEGVYATDQEIIDDLGADNLSTTSGASYVVQEGDAKYRDINGDGDIDADDRVIIGDPNPDFTYTFNLKANYKNIDASLLFTGVQGVDAFNGNIFNLESQEIPLNRGVQVLDRWQQSGDITNVPRFRFGQNANNEISTRYIEDASYLRLRNVTLGYTIDSKVLSGMFNGTLSKVRVYAQGQNLLTITDYSGLDPEIEPYYTAAGILVGRNIDRGRGPQPTTILAGLQIEF